MGILNKIEAARGRDESRFSIDQYLTDYLLPSNQFTFGNTTYPLGIQQTYGGNYRSQEIASTLPGYANALRRCPPAFAAAMVRALVLSQARFLFRNPSYATTRNGRKGNPRETFGNRDLGILERPWPNATTGELLSRMEWHVSCAGNSFVHHAGDRLRVLRPDWVTIVYGSQQEPEDAAHALDGEILGYVYVNGGLAGAGRNKPRSLLPDEVAHWSPLPDPECAGIGMSWLTPAIREIQGDGAATDHKLRFFSQGATPNMVVKGLTATTKEQFDELVEMMDDRHAGLRNAYKTLYLTAGADVTVVGTDLKQMDFKAVQGAGETRIAFLSRVPAPILGIAEGLAGSSLNAGNFGMARRIFADSWVYPTLQDVSMALAPLVNVPVDAELWFDTADMPLLREDAKDAAEIQQIQAVTISALVTQGFTPESCIAAVMGQNMQLLVHSGLVSVQLQPPGVTAGTQGDTGGSKGPPRIPPRPIVRPPRKDGSA